MLSRVWVTLKSREVRRRLKKIAVSRGIKVNEVFAFGYKFDSGFWIAVQTDADKKKLLADSALLKELNDVFTKSGYTALIERVWKKELNLPSLEYLKTPAIAVESQETVERDFRGNWYYATK